MCLGLMCVRACVCCYPVLCASAKVFTVPQVHADAAMQDLPGFINRLEPAATGKQTIKSCYQAQTIVYVLVNRTACPAVQNTTVTVRGTHTHTETDTHTHTDLGPCTLPNLPCGVTWCALHRVCVRPNSAVV